MELGLEARVRSRGLGDLPRPPLAAPPRDRALGETRLARARALRAGARGLERTPVPDAQVPHHADRRGGRWAAVEQGRGSAPDAGGVDPAPAIARRAAAALECSRGTHEPRRPAPRAARLRRSLSRFDPALHAPP